MTEGADKRRSVPLVRTEGDATYDIGQVTPELLAVDPRLLRRFKTKRTEKAEDALILGDCLYFYVGHVCPDFGDMVFVYDPAISAGWTGTATPFDTGGIIGYIHAKGLPGKALDQRKRDAPAELSPGEKKTFREHVHARRISSLREWQPRFEAFIAAHYGCAAEYVRGNRPKPKNDDEAERHLHAGNDRRAWTWEIQAHRDHNIFDGLWLLRLSSEKHQKLADAIENDNNNPWWRVLEDASIFLPSSASETKTEVCNTAEEVIASWV